MKCPNNFNCRNNINPCQPAANGQQCNIQPLELPLNIHSECRAYRSTGRIAYPGNSTKYIYCLMQNKILVGKAYDCVPPGVKFNVISKWCEPIIKKP